MDLHGQHLIGSTLSGQSTQTFTAVNPATREALPPAYHEATPAEVDRAAALAASAFERYRLTAAEDRARLLEAIADQITALGDALLDRAHAETGLPLARLTGERLRTVNQARLFAQVVREGSWVDARIDRAQPDRQPLPKPDIRSMRIALGPVAVFGASNFPLAISVAGSDTVSALGAGCSVVVKAHPAHPGTCELVGRAILRAVERTRMPEGTFALLHGAGHEVGLALVRHPAIKAVAFTGSWRGGRALYDAAAARAEPIPVYAEMGSVNPVFLLPGALEQRAEKIAEGYIQSVTLGVGQFCTNPGLVLGQSGGGGGLERFVDAAVRAAAATAPATMLHAGICRAFADGVARLAQTPGVRLAGQSQSLADPRKTQAGCVIFTTDLDTFEAHAHLSEEVFGPASLVVNCQGAGDFERVAQSLSGQLTATVHGTPQDLSRFADLLHILERKVGRIIFNGFPTGLEVCPALFHGGPYPATTDSHFTSIGTGAMLRWGRGMCYQGFPDDALPAELRNRNARGIWRMIDGVVTKDDGA